MVHALNEAWRVLRQDGILIDLRPLHANITLEAVTGEQSILLTRYTREIPDINDRAADTAMALAVDENRFQFKDSATFEYVKFYDSGEDLLEYNANRHSPIVHPDDVVRQIKLADSNPDMTLRVGNQMLLKTYRRCDDLWKTV